MAVEQLAESGRLSPPISASVLTESEDDWGSGEEGTAAEEPLVEQDSGASASSTTVEQTGTSNCSKTTDAIAETSVEGTKNEQPFTAFGAAEGESSTPTCDKKVQDGGVDTQVSCKEEDVSSQNECESGRSQHLDEALEVQERDSEPATVISQTDIEEMRTNLTEASEVLRRMSR